MSLLLQLCAINQSSPNQWHFNSLNSPNSSASASASPPLPPHPNRPLRIILCTTGSVASIKTPLIVEEFRKYKWVQVQVVATRNSLRFYDRMGFESGGLGDDDDDGEEELPVKVWTDEDEWKNWSKIGDPILHIELRKWADIILIAPCSANTLAKIANGMCDDLLSSLLRALPQSPPHTSRPTTSQPPPFPVQLFPAMNTQMYLHPHTKKHLDVVKKELGYKVWGPQGVEMEESENGVAGGGGGGKKLACGDVGIGAMMEWSEIVQLVVSRYGLELKKQYNNDNEEEGIGVKAELSLGE